MAAEEPIPLLTSCATEKIKAITDEHKLPSYSRLYSALTTIFFKHQDLWSPDKQGARMLKRSAAKIHTATKKYMSVLSSDSTFAELLCTAVEPQGHSQLPIGDINTLTALLKRLLDNSSAARQATSARGRGKDALAVTVSEDLEKLYDKWRPPSPGPTLRGESRNDIRARFVHDAASLLGVTLAEASIRTYREKKHKRRVRR